MLVILSPAKNLDFSKISNQIEVTEPVFTEKTSQLVKVLQQFSAGELAELMNMSASLGELNYIRYKNWDTETHKKAALLTYNGEVFNGLQAKSLNAEHLQFANNHVCILSGLYGVLRALDVIQPYRLDMEHKLRVDKHKNLYSFWGNTIHEYIKHQLERQPDKTLINLASNEYAKAIKFKQLESLVITPVFKQLKGEQYRVITIYAKKARGLMTRFIVENQLSDLEQIKLFDKEGYFYNEPLSNETEWVFTR